MNRPQAQCRLPLLCGAVASSVSARTSMSTWHGEKVGPRRFAAEVVRSSTMLRRPTSLSAAGGMAVTTIRCAPSGNVELKATR